MPEPEEQGPAPEEQLQTLVERRGALRAKMSALREESPEDHDGFLRTVDQLLAVSNEIIDRLNPPAAPAEGSGAGGDGPGGAGAVEGGAQEGPTGGAEHDPR